MKIYVASSWRNQRQQTVVSDLREVGHDVYDFRNPAPGNTGFHWSDIDPEWQGWDTASFIKALQSPEAESGYGYDMEGLVWADACVLVLPSGRSSHLEAGYFPCVGKPLIILLDDSSPIEPELMYKMSDLITADVTEVKTFLTRDIDKGAIQ